jgi:hypothetical protein
MRNFVIILISFLLAGCKYELVLHFNQKNGVATIEFNRRVIGLIIPFEMSCLSGVTVTAKQRQNIVWKMQRESDKCYSGSEIAIGQRVAGYSHYFESLEPNTPYVVSVYGSGASGNGEFVFSGTQGEL